MLKLENKNNRRINSSNIAFYTSLITIIGLFFLSYNYVMTKKVIVHDYINSKLVEEEIQEIQEVVIETEIKEGEAEDTSTYDNSFIGFLKIPKINLEKGFVDKRSDENDVEKNIFVAESSTYPNVAKGNLIIAGHSGTGWKAFFNDLYQLNINDQAIISYKGKDYTYKLKNIYKETKDGTVTIKRNKNKTTLTLITCTNNDNTTQTVYIFEME